MRGIHKKLTRIDTWYKVYCDNSARRQHRADKKLYEKIFRQKQKKDIQEALSNITDNTESEELG